MVKSLAPPMHDSCSVLVISEMWTPSNDVRLCMQINGHHRLDDYQTRGQEPAGEVQVSRKLLKTLQGDPWYCLARLTCTCAVLLAKSQ